MALAGLAATGLIASGCGGDPDARSGATTAAPATSSPTDGADGTRPDLTTTSASPEHFDEVLAGLRATLDAAGDDFCAVARSARSEVDPGPPQTPGNVETLLNYYETLFLRMADVLPDEAGFDADDAATLRTASAEMIAQARASGFDPSAIPPNRIPARIDEPDVAPVMERITDTVAERCDVDQGVTR